MRTFLDCLGQLLSTGADLTFKGYLAKFGDRFCCRSSWEVGGGSATGIYWVEARDDAKHPKVYRTVTTQRIIWANKSIMPRLKDPAPKNSDVH